MRSVSTASERFLEQHLSHDLDEKKKLASFFPGYSSGRVQRQLRRGKQRPLDRTVRSSPDRLGLPDSPIMIYTILRNSFRKRGLSANLPS